MGPRWTDVLALVRVSSFATPAFDVVSGAAIANALTSSGLPLLPTLGLAAGSILLYWSGLVLNDLVDLEKDRVDRPSRPIPSGRVSVRFARGLAVGLAIAALSIGALVGIPALAFVAATLGAVLVYDLLAKRAAAPAGFAMGACRGFDLTIGAAGAAGFAGAVAAWPIAAGYALYIACLTWVGRFESARSASPGLFAAGAAGSALPALLAILPSSIGATQGEPGVMRAGQLVLVGFSLLLGWSLWQVRGKQGPELAASVRDWVRRAVLGILFLHCGLLATVGEPLLALAAIVAWFVARPLARRFSPS